MTDLTLLCVSAGEPYAHRFVGCMRELAAELDAGFVLFDGAGAGAVERVLDEALSTCPDGYVLRLDDDERCSAGMRDWLLRRRYREHDHWCFPRANLYPDAGSYVVTSPLWPDLQTRLSVKEKAGGRLRVHEGSPFGTGRLAPQAVIEHWKFLARPAAERRRLLRGYERLQAGAGTGHYSCFSLPELFRLRVAPYWPGRAAA